jgi:L-threonine kinase
MRERVASAHAAAVAESVPTLGMGCCPLVVGECVQGRMASGRHFLITSPIGLFSWAEFAFDPSLRRLTVEPADRTKSLAAVARYLAAEGLPGSGRLTILTPLDPGQGFGTSTADIAAALRAAAASIGRRISPEAIASIAIEIEPSDGSMFPGCVAFAHREGLLLETLGSLPPFEAAVACTGGTVDTVAFDERRRDFRYTERDTQALLRAWEMMRFANVNRDVSLMARATTISASINEQLLPKPLFREMLEFSEITGVDGLMAAHSGTAIALILDPLRPGFRERVVQTHDFLASLGLPVWFRISNEIVCQEVRPHSLAPTPPADGRVQGPVVKRTSPMPGMATMVTFGPAPAAHSGEQ